MNIFSRLYKIISAKLPHSENESGQVPLDRRKSFKYTTGDRAQSETGHPHYDPILAECYANLELPYGADRKRVRQAWKKMVKQYHPDLHATDPAKRQVAHKLSQGLNRAYEEIIKRPVKMKPTK